MKVSVIGNCQIAALLPVLQAVHGDVQCIPLPAVHTMQNQHHAVVKQSCEAADWIIAQLVTDDYPVEFVRTNVLKALYGDRVISWPSLYFSGYAPEYSSIRDPNFRNFTGPLLDYHSDKILMGFSLGWSVQQTYDLIKEPCVIDQLWYEKSVEIGLAELRRREQTSDIVMSDFVEERFSKARLFHIMNHPSIDVMVELANRILFKIGVRNRTSPPNTLLHDFELLSAWYPENLYIREKYKLNFQPSRLYRGVQLVPADNVLGVVPSGPRIYAEKELIEAMFLFYEPHRGALQMHGRIRELLSRRRS